ncbi:MAG TPA: glycosyltransferase family 4 protein [Candidatus Binatia bacterium]|nr:glycosyltransferase family 4 protein [Candidatus Binatia bacterium]
MRICRILQSLPSAASPGGNIGIYRLAQYIPEPCLLLARAADTYPPLPSHVELVPLALRDSTMPAGLRAGVFHPGVGPVGRARVQAHLIARTLRYHGRAVAVALREARRFRPDLVVCHSLQRLVYGVAIRAVVRCPLVLYLHNSSEVEALRTLPFLRLLLRIPDRVAAVSPDIARQLTTWLPEARIWLTSTGVDTDRFSNWGRPRRRQLVTVAHLKWTKGYDVLLEAVQQVFLRLPDYRLLVVGDGEERERITRDVHRRGLQEHVVLTGVLPRAEVVRVLNESRLFVLASIHEGLPKALLEALACGTPAVVTDRCNAEGLIEATGVSVPAGDPAAFADAVTALLTDEARWQRCSERSPEVAARYDWRRVAARDYALYRMLLAPPAAGDGVPPTKGSRLGAARPAGRRAGRDVTVDDPARLAP